MKLERKSPILRHRSFSFENSAQRDEEILQDTQSRFQARMICSFIVAQFVLIVIFTTMFFVALHVTQNERPYGYKFRYGLSILQAKVVETIIEFLSSSRKRSYSS